MAHEQSFYYMLSGGDKVNSTLTTLILDSTLIYIIGYFRKYT
jgi:hypothetical protein